MITKCPYGIPIDCSYCADNWNCKVYLRDHLMSDAESFGALLKEMVEEGSSMYWLARHFGMGEADIREHLGGGCGEP